MRLQSERFLAQLVEPGTPRYPAYTGKEACASVGSEMFCTDEKDFSHYEVLRGICMQCPLLKDCFNWALHNEDFHMTEKRYASCIGSRESEAWLHNVEPTSSST